ncbi:aminoglycoside phosphotransferase family protein [Nonomuraea turkmeniaca]|uniref:Aminoglycoside phosphotransferase family protein n=1 Tax=Nonomuraea turkmeniaca TaxID=103838 RepID=A0A5S4FI21_9ACTN|nr:aminoglycoside phosphotransferase family protein [Nonomuraea turkmeniaca]TMR18694.1 aminoglycoside phosphotransferase family protein [Nonomuraea turkmeniaca]
MADLQHTHELVYDGDVVTKRYVDGKQGGAEREWRALSLLAEHAPGLAPEPIAFEAGVVSMTRIDGVSLRGLSAGNPQVTAMAEALDELHAAVPAAVLETVPIRPWQRAAVSDWVLHRAAAWQPRDPLADQAVKEGLRWLESWRPDESGVRPVFGGGDGNLANFLWDGARVRRVDFEDSGRSDLAFEVAELAEHVSMWVEGEVDIARRFELSPPEERLMRDYRKLHSMIWLFLLSHESPRNPPGTFQRQVERALATLGA